MSVALLPTLARRRLPRPAPVESAEVPHLVTLRAHGNRPLFGSTALADLVFAIAQRHPATLASCLMPDHLSWVIRAGWEIGETVGRFKAHTSRLCREQGHPVPLWQPGLGSRPLAARGSEQLACEHVLETPVRAGLVGRRDDYRWQMRRCWRE